MKATRENILNILREHPGLRKREIASYLHYRQFTRITTLYEMEEDGLLQRINVHDTANIDFYEKYYVAEDVLENGASAFDPDDL